MYVYRPKYREDGNRYATHDRQAQSAHVLSADASVYVCGAAPAPVGACAAGLPVCFSCGIAAETAGAAVPVLLVLLVLPLRYSFAEAMVRRDGRRYFSFDTALNLGNYGEKLAESLLHAAHVIKWGIPFFAMLIYGYYWYKEVDALTLLSTLTRLGRGWTNVWCSVANFFLELVGGAQLTPPQNTLMDGVAAVLAVLGLGVAVWLYGAVRNRCGALRMGLCQPQ